MDQQYHLDALRNNIRMMRQLGPDTGWDSIGDFSRESWRNSLRQARQHGSTGKDHPVQPQPGR